MHEALGGHAFVAKHAQKPTAIHRCLGEFAVVEQALVGVGGVGQPVHKRWQEDRLEFRLAGRAFDQRSQVVKRARRVAVAQGCQLVLHTGGGKCCFTDGEVHHGVQQRAVEETLVQRGHLVADGLEMPVHRLRGGTAWPG